MIKLCNQVKTFRVYSLFIFIYLLSSCGENEIRKTTLKNKHNQEIKCDTSETIQIGCAKVKLGISFDCIQQMNNRLRFRKSLESSTEEKSIYNVSFGHKLDNKCLSIQYTYGLGTLSLFTDNSNNNTVDSVSVSFHIQEEKIRCNIKEIINEINSIYEGSELELLLPLRQNNSKANSPTIRISESDLSGAFQNCSNIKITYK